MNDVVGHPKPIAATIRSCPRCGVGEGLREILYGLPAGPPDESKYIVGGCCVDENSPEIGCVECGWQGKA